MLPRKSWPSSRSVVDSQVIGAGVESDERVVPERIGAVRRGHCEGQRLARVVATD